jgi:inorganic pyrophosphatase
MDFWTRMEKLISESRIVIDRPKDSVHPRYPEFIYPLDYGYLEGTSAADGNCIDVWCGSGNGHGLVGIAATVDSLKKDTEIKILIDCTESDIALLRKFYDENKYMSGMVILRGK